MLSTTKHQNIPNLVDSTHIGSATASFEGLVTLHKRILQQMFGSRIHTTSFGHDNSGPGARIPQTM